MFCSCPLSPRHNLCMLSSDKVYLEKFLKISMMNTLFWDVFFIMGCIFYHFIVLDTVWKCPDCKKRDIWQNRRPSDYPLPCLCQRRHHILWCFKWRHLRLERAHPGPNHSRGTQCEYCQMELRGGMLNTLGPHFSMFLPSALQSEDVTTQF